MGMSNSILAYEKEADLFEQALRSPKGIKVHKESESEAVYLIHRCNKFRALDRKRNKTIYVEPAHEMHGASVYDRIQVKRNGTIVKFEKLPPTEQATVEEIE